MSTRISREVFSRTTGRKQTHADYNGSGLIDGKEYWLNLWINSTRDGKKRLNLKFKPKQGGRA